MIQRVLSLNCDLNFYNKTITPNKSLQNIVTKKKQQQKRQKKHCPPVTMEFLHPLYKTSEDNSTRVNYVK